MGYLNTVIRTSSSEVSSYYQVASGVGYLDLSDKLNWQVTINILIILTLVLTNIRRFVSKIISCAVPIYFSENQEEYANQMCYVSEDKYAANESNTILIGPNQTLVYFRKSKTMVTTNNVTSMVDVNLNAGDDKSPTLIGSYYIWVPYVLVFLVLLLFLVKCLWLYLLKYQFRDVDLYELLKAAVQCKDLPIDKFIFYDSNGRICINQLLFKNNYINYIFSNLTRLIQANHERERDSRIVCKSYLLIKLLSMCLVFIQTLLINQFLGIDIYSLGYNKLHSYVNYFRHHINTDKEVSNDDPSQYYHINSVYFPLKAVCVFRIRELASILSYAVVCSLPVNLFIQFAFSILSLWFIALFVLNLAYLVKWCLNFERHRQAAYVEKMLVDRLKLISMRSRYKSSCLSLCHRRTDEIDDKQKCRKCHLLFNLFFDSFLSSDVVFLLRIMSLSSSTPLIENIIVYYWKIFIDFIETKKF